MFTFILAAAAFVVGTLLDKILFLLGFLLLWRWLRYLRTRLCLAARLGMARLRHRLRHIIGPTVWIRR